MSQHIHKTKHRTITYGYDGRLREYFISIYDPYLKKYVHRDSSSLGMANSELYKILRRYKAPSEHLTMLMMDLPF